MILGKRNTEGSGMIVSLELKKPKQKFHLQAPPHQQIQVLIKPHRNAKLTNLRGTPFMLPTMGHGMFVLRCSDPMWSLTLYDRWPIGQLYKYLRSVNFQGVLSFLYLFPLLPHCLRPLDCLISSSVGIRKLNPTECSAGLSTNWFSFGFGSMRRTKRNLEVRSKERLVSSSLFLPDLHFWLWCYVLLAL